jgi:ABC-type amino acid transport/signal transduction systems, periplasmic component/domain
MKKLGILALLAITSFGLIACSKEKESVGTEAEVTDDKGEKKTLIIGTEAGFAPYEYMEGTEVVGVDMDICQAIATAMGAELEIRNMDFDGALLAVQQGQIDLAAAGISITEERQQIMDFSDYYVDSSVVIVVNTAEPAVTESSADALKDKIVGVQQGNTADLWVSDIEEVQPAEIRRYTKFAQAADDLKNNKIDVIVMDELPALELVSLTEGLMIVEGDPLFVEQYAIAVKKGNQELLDQVNEVIAQLIADGKIDEFIANHAK